MLAAQEVRVGAGELVQVGVQWGDSVGLLKCALHFIHYSIRSHRHLIPVNTSYCVIPSNPRPPIYNKPRRSLTDYQVFLLRVRQDFLNKNHTLYLTSFSSLLSLRNLSSTTFVSTLNSL